MRNKPSLQNKHIDVLFSFDGREQYARPVRLTWNNRDYWLGGVQFWYSERRGSVLVHHYRVSDEQNEYSFELSLETENLTWGLKRVTTTQARGVFGMSQPVLGVAL